MSVCVAFCGYLMQSACCQQGTGCRLSFPRPDLSPSVRSSGSRLVDASGEACEPHHAVACGIGELFYLFYACRRVS
ncbi:hypothetical protein GGR58DRAFT_453715 [Xylaria digitata]|nr:hypothetical protein GGR58DRAFT_453715 [Xylaria digitata]